MNLTKRQTEIVSLLAQGNTAEQVANTMHRSVGTVRRHVVLACERVEARNVTHLVAKSILQGWICLLLVISISLHSLDHSARLPRVRTTRSTTYSRYET
ncbi:helix-turn-helix transcriptional regulator [Salinicola sp. CPA57]|uniref:response regulator transcription factor n=1 Tax=Salinicola sp. CPA57 TaxID=1949080 RepID=UPI000DA1B694|nr:helix-turn-helix transcriptional regulator [Salinicola sp. CPA57]